MKSILYLALCTALLFDHGCSKSMVVDTANWSKPEVVSRSQDSISTSFTLYKWNHSLVALNGDSGSLAVYLPQSDCKSWKEKITSHLLNWAFLSCDPKANRIVIGEGTVPFPGNRMDVTFLMGSINPDGSLTIRSNKSWAENTAEFFGTTGKNVYFLHFGGEKHVPGHAVFARGVVTEPNISIPYNMMGDTVHGKGTVAAEGPFSSGVYYSLDSGETWQREQVADFYVICPSFSQTERFQYYFMGLKQQNALHFSRKPLGGGSWSPPEVITKTFGSSGFITRVLSVGEGDTVHLCWMDQRHEKLRLNLYDRHRENYEVAYCHRKDSDANWSKDVILSAGLLYSFAPVMSVEGDKIVVAWAGVKSAADGHGEFSPNDIYYVTSKDGGKTWAKPLKVTDGAKDGITAGTPQVALQNGIIHLFYVQGKINMKKESPGLTKLNQPPWPIYYQQRPFPD